MAKVYKTADETQALSAIYRYRGCETVGRVGINPIDDDRAGYNWSITVDGLGTAEGDVRTALHWRFKSASAASSI